MVKLNISFEGEKIEDILTELINLGITIAKTHKKEIVELIDFLSRESIEVLMNPQIIEKGAQLYRKINSEINFQYKKG